VYYAGSVIRQGTNSELHLVDERIAGRKPANLSFAEAAALPLTTLTAWELMFDRMGISKTGAHAGAACSSSVGRVVSARSRSSSRSGSRGCT
jgi:NADPH:quinone reductase-like Zn-dependent oxidoreductase